MNSSVVVNTSQARAPAKRPKKPAKMDPIRGRKTIA
jgi:hypothetical protein